jgi:hypothetical protein
MLTVTDLSRTIIFVASEKSLVKEPIKVLLHRAKW